MVVAYLKSVWGGEEVRPSLCPTIENPDLVLQETGSSPTHSRLNYVSSGDTLRRDAMSSFFLIIFFNNSRKQVAHKPFRAKNSLSRISNLLLQQNSTDSYRQHNSCCL